VTVITQVDDATEVRGSLGEFLKLPPAVETTDHALLAPSAEWYRVALQRVTQVALDVIDARAVLPLTEDEAFKRPSDTAVLLIPCLSAASDSYRRACPSYESTETFWLDFFRRPPARKLVPAGRWLWNLAG
jgi:hypothetical protein